MKVWRIPVCLATALAAGAVFAGAIREVEVTADPPAGGTQIFTVRLRPGTNMVCESVDFECVYAQELPADGVGGGRGTKTHEPACHTYRRLNVNLVEDLDCFVSFRVPMAMEKLVENFNVTTFATNRPVWISKIRISGSVKGEMAWFLETPASGVHAATNTAPPDDDLRAEPAERHRRPRKQ